MTKALKRSVLWCFLLVPCLVFSQGRELRSIELKEALKMVSPGQTLPVYLRGNTDAIAAFVREQGGRLKAQFGNIVEISKKIPHAPCIKKVNMLILKIG